MNFIKQNKKQLIGILSLVAAIIVFLVIFFVFREKAVAGSKSITISVTGKSADTITYDIKTDAEYLRQAMEEAEGLTFSGDEGEYGMMVKTVNGDTADFDADGAYWAFYVNDEYCNYGIDTQPVNDNDKFGIVYTIYSAE